MSACQNGFTDVYLPNWSNQATMAKNLIKFDGFIFLVKLFLILKFNEAKKNSKSLNFSKIKLIEIINHF